MNPSTNMRLRGLMVRMRPFQGRNAGFKSHWCDFKTDTANNYIISRKELLILINLKINCLVKKEKNLMTDKEKLLGGIKLIQSACHNSPFIVEDFLDEDFTA